MKVWTCTEFRGHYPVGTAAVIVAETRERAAKGLSQVLIEMGLEQPVAESELIELDTDDERVIILRDGDY